MEARTKYAILTDMKREDKFEDECVHQLIIKTKNWTIIKRLLFCLSRHVKHTKALALIPKMIFMAMLAVLGGQTCRNRQCRPLGGRLESKQPCQGEVTALRMDHIVPCQLATRQPEL
jgi:hypothetical protein